MASNGLPVNGKTVNLYRVRSRRVDEVYMSRSYAVQMAKRLVARGRDVGPVTILEGTISWGDCIELPDEVAVHNLALLGAGYEAPPERPDWFEITRIEKVGSKWHGYYADELRCTGKTRKEVSVELVLQYTEDTQIWREGFR